MDGVTGEATGGKPTVLEPKPSVSVEGSVESAAFTLTPTTVAMTAAPPTPPMAHQIHVCFLASKAQPLPAV